MRNLMFEVMIGAAICLLGLVGMGLLSLLMGDQGGDMQILGGLITFMGGVSVCAIIWAAQE